MREGSRAMAKFGQSTSTLSTLFILPHLSLMDDIAPSLDISLNTIHNNNNNNNILLSPPYSQSNPPPHPQPSPSSSNDDNGTACFFRDIWGLYFSENWDELDDSMQHTFTQMINKFIQLFQEDKGLLHQVYYFTF
jgi:hypothetical protein